jgi:hypothetical protein
MPSPFLRFADNASPWFAVGDVLILKQFPNYIEKENEGCFGPDAVAWDVDVFRDLDSGVEFICVYQDKALSCFSTGRRLE